MGQYFWRVFPASAHRKFRPEIAVDPAQVGDVLARVRRPSKWAQCFFPEWATVLNVQARFSPAPGGCPGLSVHMQNHRTAESWVVFADGPRRISRHREFDLRAGEQARSDAGELLQLPVEFTLAGVGVFQHRPTDLRAASATMPNPTKSLGTFPQEITELNVGGISPPPAER